MRVLASALGAASRTAAIANVNGVIFPMTLIELMSPDPTATEACPS